jgi:ethanolamine transporter EutH
MKFVKNILLNLLIVLVAMAIWFAFFEIFSNFRVYSKIIDAIIAIAIAFTFVLVGMILWTFIITENLKILIHNNEDRFVPFLAILLPFVALYYLTDKLFTAFRNNK